ncbi:hypothetical protein O3P69_006439 [Scylla paramamosain]|uniref:Ig-like domain-containing protein n=1 Tax=Scylla paramamosain TaxID=85552 RepID=A0AAW0U4M9_SCYPA
MPLQVSWIRGRDLRILTVGRYTYTTDLRYEALHQNGTNQWTLRIRSAQPRDQGTYECQVSTKPVKTFITYLRVLEPRGEILGSPDLYVQKGSMINLTCVLHDLPEPPRYVRWYHSNKHHNNRDAPAPICDVTHVAALLLDAPASKISSSNSQYCLKVRRIHRAAPLTAFVFGCRPCGRPRLLLPTATTTCSPSLGTPSSASPTADPPFS